MATPGLNQFLFSTLPQQLMTPRGPTATAEAGGREDDKNGTTAAILAALKQGGGGMNLPPELWEKLLRPEDPLGQVGRANATSNLASGVGGNPWASGFFKPHAEAFKDTGVRENPVLPFANPASMANRGETIQQPNDFSSSFMGNSGDVMGEGGAVGRSAADRYGSGSSTFPAPQPATGQRLAGQDENLASLFAKLVGQRPRPGQGGLSFGAGMPRLF